MTSVTELTLFTIILTIGCSAKVKDTSIDTNDINYHFIQANINSLFDSITKKYTENLAENGGSEVQIPGFHHEVSIKLVFVKISAAVVVDDGWFGNLSTIHRTGDAEIEQNLLSAVLTAHLGLSVIKIRYDNYDISVVGVHQKGYIEVDVGKNSVWIKLNATLLPECSITLSDLKIEKLDDISVMIGNLGIFEDLTDILTSIVANEVTKLIKNHIEQNVFLEIAKIVKDSNLCKYI